LPSRSNVVPLADDQCSRVPPQKAAPMPQNTIILLFPYFWDGDSQFIQSNEFLWAHLGSKSQGISLERMERERFPMEREIVIIMVMSGLQYAARERNHERYLN
jgi:hypothetical protein